MKLFYRPKHARTEDLLPGEEGYCGKCVLGAHHDGFLVDDCSCECYLVDDCSCECYLVIP